MGKQISVVFEPCTNHYVMSWTAWLLTCVKSTNAQKYTNSLKMVLTEHHNIFNPLLRCESIFDTFSASPHGLDKWPCTYTACFIFAKSGKLHGKATKHQTVHKKQKITCLLYSELALQQLENSSQIQKCKCTHNRHITWLWHPQVPQSTNFQRVFQHSFGKQTEEWDDKPPSCVCVHAGEGSIPTVIIQGGKIKKMCMLFEKY